MPEPALKNTDDPRPWIYAVLATAFLSGNVLVLLYLVFQHALPELADWGWALYLGGFLGFGLLGMLVGGVGGLFIKLVFERVTGDLEAGGWPAVIASGVLSVGICLPSLWAVLGIPVGE